MDLRPFNPSNCASDWDAAYYDQLGPAAKYQSEYKGNAKARDGIDSDGDGQVDECHDNDGVEGWWGLCHAWVPASILEQEPQHAVTYNGVTFEVGDLKALLITEYDRTSAYMLGGRCNEKEVDRDEHGRITDDRCRDTNPGSFHVVVTNMLGIHKRSFAEDRTYDYEVWNQPFYDYRILNQEEVSAQEAMADLGQPDTTEYTYNNKAERFYKVRTRVRYLTEPHQTTTYPLVPLVENEGRHLGSDTYDYILELDAEGTIIGGEWMTYSQTTHPDFLWLPTASRGGNPHVDLDQVQMLLAMSVQPDEPTEPDEIISAESTNTVNIPDNDPNGITSTITIDDNIAIGSLKIAVDIDHTWSSDLRVVLEREGASVTLHDRTGGASDDIKRTFDVADFNGQSARGTWTLHVSDHASRDTGTLNSWSVKISTGSLNASDAVSYDADDLPLTIPDNDDAGVSSKISISDSGAIASLQIKVELTHTYVGDLTLTLIHGGVTKVLHGREGGSQDDIIKTYNVDEFDGSAITGDWTLQVSDQARRDTGALDAWSLVVITR